jgi:hypothetical protein
MIRLLFALLIFINSLPIFAGTPVQITDFDSSKIWKELIHSNHLTVDTNKGDVGSALDLLALNASTVENVVLMTLNPYLGDNIIYEYGKINFLHRKFPNAKITVLTPTSSVFNIKALELQPWLHPVPVPIHNLFTKDNLKVLMKQPELLKDIILKQIEDGIPSNSLVIWNDYFERIARDLFQYMNLNFKAASINATGGDQKISAALEASAREAELLFKELLVKRKASSLALKFRNNVLNLVAKNPTQSEQSFNLEILKKVEPLNTRYEYSAFYSQVLFGTEAGLEWDENLYLDPNWRELISTVIQSSFKDPEKPLLIINLNTRGKEKVLNLKRDFAERMDGLLQILVQNNPEVNIMIAPVEEAFGRNAIDKSAGVIQRFIESGANIAYFPTDRRLHGALYKHARAVIIQDSGNNHLAGIFNDHVLNMSRECWNCKIAGHSQNYRGEAGLWRKPGQKYLNYGAKAPYYGDGLLLWVNNLLSTNVISCRDLQLL